MDSGDTWFGQTGFAIQVPADTTSFSASDLLSVNDTEGATWTVHLNAMKYGAGVLSTVAGSNNRPYANDVQVNSTAAWQAVISFGANQGTETAYVDYPARGCTFEMQAQLVRLGVTGFKGTGAQPLLSGYMVRKARNRPTMGSTLTVLMQGGGVGTIILEPIPPRAVGYRLFYTSTDPAYAVRMMQLTNDALITVSVDRPIAGPYPQAFDSEPDNRAPNFTPIHPRATYLSALLTVPGTQGNLYAQFDIDLG